MENLLIDIFWHFTVWWCSLRRATSHRAYLQSRGMLSADRSMLTEAAASCRDRSEVDALSAG
eukprot:14677-Heterococcus_DN1.PRE.1